MNAAHCRVAVIGAGPTGLAVAAELAAMGFDGIVVIDRESSAGGIPRHCGHSPFGLREFGRLLGGPAYARRLTRRALERGVQLRLATSVVGIEPGPRLMLSSDAGVETLTAARVIICTGNRETPRAPRLVSGARPLGVTTTGALQSTAYLKRRIPFRRPVVIGSELVACSALLTCRHFGIRPRAMIEPGPKMIARWPAAWLPGLLGVRLLTNTSLLAIQGETRVSAVAVVTAGRDAAEIDCDGVIFSGCFVAETGVLLGSHLEIDDRARTLAVDQYGRCSDPVFFAGGNLLHPVDSAGWCWAEGRRLARWVGASLTGELADPERRLRLELPDSVLNYATPRYLALPDPPGMRDDHPGIQLRFDGDYRGRLSLCDGETPLVQRRVNARRERRILLRLPRSLAAGDRLRLQFEPSGEQH